MGDAPTKNTYIRSGEIEVSIHDNKITAKKRNKMALELFENVVSSTEDSRKRMELIRR